MKVDTSLKGKPCIYKITNLVDGKIYVGKAKCLVSRSYNYNSSFKQARHDHINDYLFNAMTKHGYENFIIEPLAFYEVEELAEKELAWIRVLKSNDRSIGYNLRLDSSTGMLTAPETSAKISENLTEQWASGIRDGHSEKLKSAWLKTPERNEEVGKQFTKSLTRYEYKIMDTSENVLEVCQYKRLQELNLDRVLCKFWKKNSDKVPFKTYIIERVWVYEV